MKDYDKEIENIFLDEEEDVLERIRIVYQNSLKDVQAYAKSLQKELDELLKKVDPNDEIGLTKIRSKVYQLGYQKKLAQQISNYLDVIKDKDVNNITDYINKVYSNGFLTEQYRLMRSGIDITMPINQKLLKKAVTFNIDDIPLSTRLYKNVDKAKKEIINEISRGLSIGMSVPNMARNLQNTMGVSMRKAYQIAQNEGARVRQSAIIDSMREAKKKGADIVKQWSATLDGKTRPVHQELDGEWAEIEDDFKYSGGKVFAPKQFGIPSEDINCRCTLLSVPRWDLEDKHWQLDNERKELVKVKNYEEWYETYYRPKLKNTKILNGNVINPMNEELYNTIVKNLMKNGIKVINASGDDLRFLQMLGAEATYSQGYIYHMGEIPSASALFEEIIHSTQCRIYGELQSTNPIELYAREIDANRMLLKNGKAYGFDEYDMDDIEKNLKMWENMFKERTGIDYDESGYDRTIIGKK